MRRSIPLPPLASGQEDMMCDPIDEEWTEADDIIEEVREIRRKISAQFDDDPVRLGA